MLHQTIHLRRQLRHRTLGLSCVNLGECAKGLHLAVEDLITTLHVFDELASVNVRVTTVGHIIDHFGWDEDVSDSGRGRMGRLVCCEVGKCGERTDEIDAAWMGLSIYNG